MKRTYNNEYEAPEIILVVLEEREVLCVSSLEVQLEEEGEDILWGY